MPQVERRPRPRAAASRPSHSQALVFLLDTDTLPFQGGCFAKFSGVNVLFRANELHLTLGP